MATPQQKLDKQLLKAAKKGDNEAVIKLLDEGADINATSSFWVNTPLIAAAWEGKYETVKLLLDRGALMNKVNGISYTAMNAAAASGYSEIVGLLFDRGADASIGDTKGRMPFDTALKENHVATAQFIAEKLAGRVRLARERDERRSAAGLAREKALSEKLAVEKEAAAKQAAQDHANVVIFTQKVGDLTVEDAFNFAALERMTFVRKEPGGPVESMTRQDFSEVSNQRLLRKAFDEHVKRGGTVPEGDVFPNSLRKQAKFPGSQP